MASASTHDGVQGQKSSDTIIKRAGEVISQGRTSLLRTVRTHLPEPHPASDAEPAVSLRFPEVFPDVRIRVVRSAAPGTGGRCGGGQRGAHLCPGRAAPLSPRTPVGNAQF